MPTTTHCIIATPGLSNLVISPLRADSTVEIVEQERGYNLWIGLLVDGKFWPLVMWKHTVGRPEHHASVQAAYTLVQDAINSLKPVTPDLGNEPLPNPEPLVSPELTSLFAALGPNRRTVADIWRSLGITRKKLQAIITLYRNELALAGVNLHTATHAEAGRLSLYVNDGERRVAAISWVTEPTELPSVELPSVELPSVELPSVEQPELPAFVAALGSTRRPVATGVSFPTARTVIANTAQRNYEHWELMGKLASFGKLPPNAARMSRRSLAMRLAWVLLPGGIERVNGGLL